MVLREKGERTRELICKCQFNKRQLNIIPFKKETFLKLKDTIIVTLFEPKTKDLNPFGW